MQQLTDVERDFLVSNFNHLEKFTQEEILRNLEKYFDPRTVYVFMNIHGLHERIRILENTLAAAGYKTKRENNCYTIFTQIDGFVKSVYVGEDAYSIVELFNNFYGRLQRKKKQSSPFSLDEVLNTPFSKIWFTKMVELESFKFDSGNAIEDFNNTIDAIEQIAMKYEWYHKLIHDSDYKLLTEITKEIKSFVNESTDCRLCFRKDILIRLTKLAKLFIDELENLDFDVYEIFPFKQLFSLYPMNENDFKYYFNGLLTENDFEKFSDLMNFEELQIESKDQEFDEDEKLIKYRGKFTKELIVRVLNNVFGTATAGRIINSNEIQLKNLDEQALMAFLYKEGSKHTVMLKPSKDVFGNMDFRLVALIDGMEYILFTRKNRNDLYAIRAFFDKEFRKSVYDLRIFPVSDSFVYEHKILD